MRKPTKKLGCGHTDGRWNLSAAGDCVTCGRQRKRIKIDMEFAPEKPRRKYNVDRSKWRKCNHPRTPENTYRHHNGNETCRACKNGWTGLRADAPRDDAALVIPRFNPREFAPRPLPVRDDSGRSYSNYFPPKRGAA